jgi:hypothetical protein
MHIPSAFKYITTLLLTVTVTIDANAGPISMKAAVAAYQRSSTKELSDLKTALKPPVDNLLAELDTFSTTITESGFDSGLLENLAVALDSTYFDFELQAQNAWSANSDAGKTQWSAMLNPDAESIVTPWDFYAGTGGARDRFAANVTKTLDLALTPARKRAVKIIAAARKLGVGLTIQLLPPPLIHNAKTAFNEGAMTQSNASPVTVEYVVTGSYLGNSIDGAILDDGLILIGGQYDSGAGILCIRRKFPSSTSGVISVIGNKEIMPSLKRGHWFAIFGSGDTGGLTEGNYILSVEQSGQDCDIGTVPVVVMTVGVP